MSNIPLSLALVLSFNNLNFRKDVTLSKSVSIMTLNWWEQSLHWGGQAATLGDPDRLEGMA